MRDLGYYMDLAKQNQGLNSDNKLGKLIGFKGSAISYWRTGKALPSDESMIELAKLAKVDPFVALLDLNSWRATGEAKKTYKKMLEKISTAAVALVILLYAGSADAALRVVPDGNLNILSSIHYHIRITARAAAAIAKLRVFLRGYLRPLRHYAAFTCVKAAA